jgi:hypothetical protein
MSRTTGCSARARADSWVFSCCEVVDVSNLLPVLNAYSDVRDPILAVIFRHIPFSCTVVMTPLSQVGHYREGVTHSYQTFTLPASQMCRSSVAAIFSLRHPSPNICHDSNLSSIIFPKLRTLCLSLLNLLRRPQSSIRLQVS